MLKHGLLFLALCLFAGCTATSPQFAAQHRPRVNAQDVQVFFQQPTGQYEILGIVTGRPVNGSSGGDDMDEALRDLRHQAGDLGANAVVVQTIRRPNQNSLGMSSSSMPAVGFSGLSVTGRAIYLPPERS